MINTDALCRALERANAEGPKPWHKPEGRESMVDWTRHAQRVAELYEEELPPDYAGAFRATGPADGLSQPEDLVAGGPVDEFPPGYHPRTGQKLPESLDPSARPGGGDPLADYLYQQGGF